MRRGGRPSCRRRYGTVENRYLDRPRVRRRLDLITPRCAQPWPAPLVRGGATGENPRAWSGSTLIALAGDLKRSRSDARHRAVCTRRGRPRGHRVRCRAGAAAITLRRAAPRRRRGRWPGSPPGPKRAATSHQATVHARSGRTASRHQAKSVTWRTRSGSKSSSSWCSSSRSRWSCTGRRRSGA